MGCWAGRKMQCDDSKLHRVSKSVGADYCFMCFSKANGLQRCQKHYTYVLCTSGGLSSFQLVYLHECSKLSTSIQADNKRPAFKQTTKKLQAKVGRFLKR